MKKRIAALFLALVMVLSCVFSASALIAVEDETGIRYSDGREKENQPSAFSVAVKKALNNLKNFWNRFGVLSIVLLVLAAIVIAIVISEAEQQKKRKQEKEKAPKPAHHKK